MKKKIAYIFGAASALLLILVAYNSSTEQKRATSAANYLKKCDCWTRKIHVCENYRKVRRKIISRGFDYPMTSGYHEMMKTVGKDPKRLKAKYGDVEVGLIVLGCHDQAPGIFPGVLRSGDTVRIIGAPVNLRLEIGLKEPVHAGGSDGAAAAVV